METEFTPWVSLGGGILIGLASVSLMVIYGRIFGATGILSGLITTRIGPDFSWRAVLFAGMVSAPVFLWSITGAMPEIQVPVSKTALLVGGFIVGLGVTFGAGCTSGHGVCGMARLSMRSVAATLTFMLSTAATVYLVRHVFGV